jgi:hypothetical protein
MMNEAGAEAMTMWQTTWTLCGWLACLWAAGAGACDQPAWACDGEEVQLAEAPDLTAEALPGPRPGCPREAAVSPQVTLRPDGVLEATYSHGGGCGQHDYCVGYDDSKAPGLVEVWFSHIHDGTDMCEAFISRTLKATLPPEVLGSKRLMLKTSATDEEVLRRP